MRTTQLRRKEIGRVETAGRREPPQVREIMTCFTEIKKHPHGEAFRKGPF